LRHRLGVAITALNGGELPSPAGERRILTAAATIAAGIPVDLRDTATGLDRTTSTGPSRL
jgi:hypothetical protein